MSLEIKGFIWINSLFYSAFNIINVIVIKLFGHKMIF